MTIDRETGFPKIPAGFYYKIVKFNFGGYALDVKLKRKFWGIFPYTVGSSLAHASDTEVLNAAYRALDRYKYELDLKALDPPFKKYLGTYPPKKMGKK